jgi:cell wall-associated NlpC family hydrolase
MRHFIHIAVLCSALFSGAVRADDALSESLTQTATRIGSEWTNVAQEVLLNALSLTGVKYKYGGNSPDTGFDCSGFVRYVFQQAANVTLPHGARAISQLGQAVTIDQLQPGDLVFFNTLKTAFSHVGIYVGDGRFIHAPSNGGGIHVVDMNDSYWAKRFNGARRLPVSAQAPAEVSAE